MLSSMRKKISILSCVKSTSLRIDKENCMLSRDLEVTLNSAFKRARELRHEYMTVEHLLLGLLDNASAVQVLNACGSDLSKLREELEQFVTQTTPALPEESERDTQPTLGFQRVLQRAVFHVQSSGKQEVTGANVLVAIFSEQESQAVYFLKKQDVSRFEVVNYISHGTASLSEEFDEQEQPQMKILNNRNKIR